jgi:tight adherence protein B
MPVAAVVAFIIVFALVLLSVSVGFKFFEERRKKQVANMIQMASGEDTAQAINILRDAEPDKQKGLRGLVESLHLSRKVAQQLQQAGLNWTADKLFSTMAIMAIPGLIVGLLFPFLLGRAITCVTLASIGALAPYFYVKKKRKQRLDKLEEQLPDALDFMARSMRGGHAFSISLELIGEEIADPLGQEFRSLFNEQNLGASLEVALRNFANRVPLLDARFFTSSVLLQRQTGGNLAEILTRLAYIIRERFRLKAQVKASSAHGRLTAIILTVLPILTLVGLLVTAPGYFQSMADDPDGKLLIGGAVVAQVLGNIAIKKIIKIKV